MLYADKRNLEVNLQVALLRIRDKELKFYADNLTAIGTQAALLSGFAYNAVIMVAFPATASPFLKGCFMLTTLASMSLELMCLGGGQYQLERDEDLAIRDAAARKLVDPSHRLALVNVHCPLGLHLARRHCDVRVRVATLLLLDRARQMPAAVRRHWVAIGNDRLKVAVLPAPTPTG